MACLVARSVSVCTSKRSSYVSLRSTTIEFVSFGTQVSEMLTSDFRAVVAFGYCMR